jgi:dihydroorotase
METSMLCIKNGILIDRNSPYHLTSPFIYIKDGRIVHVGDKLNVDAIEIDIEQDYISSGWMDLHTHANPFVSIGLTPDQIGVKQGVTLVVDAGSCGSSNIDSFVASLPTYQTKVRMFLNISSVGLTRLDELADPDLIDMEANRQKINAYRDLIVGLKVRASKSVMGNNMTQPFEKARELADEYDLPIMVHIGNAPPILDDVLPFLGKRDIVTHCFHGKPSKVVNGNDVLPVIRKARHRGVKFDIGHGGASFSRFTYTEAIAAGLSFETISSDLHIGCINGPVFSLSKVMDKMVALSMPFDDVVDRVTHQVAKLIKLENYGKVDVGYIADLTRFRLESKNEIGLDAEKMEIHTGVSFTPVAVWVDGKEVLINDE